MPTYSLSVYIQLPQLSGLPQDITPIPLPPCHPWNFQTVTPTNSPRL